MNTVKELFEEVEAEGGAIILEGDRLWIVADHPLPSELVEKVKAQKDELKKSLRPKPYPTPESITRPDDYKRLEGWRLELWQLVVWSAMEGPNKRVREEAEGIAWADVDREQKRQGENHGN
ncbi:hypothetical protein EPN96_08350 [bacterium]|nr:MAG: hypothetical protein EPN96_08350 [bacterium]